ncbi:MAG: hypothetical protein H6R10_3213 [Rhodocyclaceae bacterium]|nr:hypothetical protein [Rhodocyclaceae bacterium]
MPSAPISPRLRQTSKLAAFVAGLMAFVWAAGAETPAGAQGGGSEAAAAAGSIDNEQLEKALQALSWGQFKSVVSAIPKLKADVDAYGPLGWQYVQANYRTYQWRKNIRKLHEPEKRRLAELIQEAREGPGPSR